MAYVNNYLVPNIYTPYMFQGMFENDKFAQLMASGCFKADPWENVTDYRKYISDSINIPRWNMGDTDNILDIADDTAAVPVRISTSNQRVPVIHSVQYNQVDRFAQLRAGENFMAAILKMSGNRFARQWITTTFGILSAQMDVTTPTHVLDCSGDPAEVRSTANGQDLRIGALKATNLSQACALLGDVGQETFDTLVCRHNVWFDLRRDLMGTYKFAQNQAEFLFSQDQMRSLLGLKNVIVTDYLPIDTTRQGSTESTQAIYESFLLSSKGNGSCWWAFQKDPDTDIVPFSHNIRITQQDIHVYHDFAVSCDGFYYQGPLPVTSYADLVDITHWAQAVEPTQRGHREIKCIKILSRGYAGQ